jgi:hypothetical protein
MDRAELEQLDRDSLIRRAEKAGIARPSILTRPELVDELLVRSAPRPDDPTLRKVRGFFGLARDLLASVIDRGLHLPDAAERIRSLRGPPPAPPPRTAPNVLPTVTLAEIYATQGHRDRAVDTLRRVLEREPEHAAARSLLDQLQDASYAVPDPPLPPEAEEEEAAPEAKASAEETNGVTARVLDDASPATKHDVDECVAIPVDPTTLFVYWEVRDETLRLAQRSAPHGALTLRVLVVVPSWDGPHASFRDSPLDAALGDCLVRDLPAGAVARAAVGLLAQDAFVPLAHSPLLEGAPGEPGSRGAESFVRWTPHVGSIPVSPADVDMASIQRAVGRWGAQERQRRGDRSTKASRVATKS